MVKNDQPLRIIAVLFLAPYLIYCGKKYNNQNLIFLGILFLIIEIYCLLFVKEYELKLMRLVVK